MSKQYFKVCFCFRRIFRLTEAEPPEDIKFLFDRYSRDGTMTVEDLTRFLVEIQGEYTASHDDALAIFNSLKHLHIFQRRGLHFDAFYRYLLGDLNLAIPPSNVVHHDMNAPLSHYFLFTGHNSYLTGNQLSSDSSTKPIINALKRGVRVIELDLWPNNNKDDVEVRHGGTLTAPVDLVRCLRAIKDNAFEVSEYPVVITFEDHLPPNLQSKVATMVNDTFGEILYTPESDEMSEFRSPDYLKKRILISTKPPKEYLETPDSQSSGKERTPHSSFDDKVVMMNKDEAHIPEEDEEKTAPQYRHLIAIHAAKMKGGIDNMLSVEENKVRRLSMSEQELETASKTHATAIVRFTQRNLLRVYPKGSRLDSSNYSPFVGWMHGAQMVAFNMQGYGKHLWTMQGMFRANGGCGYVKKPDFLLKHGPDDKVYDPSIPQQLKTTLKGKLYLGEGWLQDFRHTHFDLCSPPDFFVKVGIEGVAGDKAKHITKVIDDEWVPIWDEEFKFELRVPELAILRIEVMDYDVGNHGFGGQTYLPISELRTGIRSVPLYSRDGTKYKHTRLLMHFEFA
ncbi:Phosphoinositide phospholipase C 2 [Linum grandiflorum]